jgi:hypothetical protein
MEVIMGKFTHPTKETVRHYMQQRKAEHKPLPDLEEIRRQLGWGLAEMVRHGKAK